MYKPEVLFEDDYILAVNKPSGLISIPDRWDADKECLYHLLTSKYPDLLVVHRLDKDTSGVILFAKTPEAHKILNDQFASNENNKEYLALVNGQVLESGSIDTPIAADPFKVGKMTVHRKGKESLTDYEPIELFRDYTLLRVKIHTGRTHQIRVHLSSINYPLAVDPLYGSAAPITIENIKKRNLRTNVEVLTPLISRVPLHALSIGISHPISKNELKIEAPLPKDFRALMSQLKKWGK